MMADYGVIHTNMKDTEEFQAALKEYEKMLKEFKEDRKMYDFSIPKEWDEDFRKMMDEVLEKKTHRNE